jgi:hypothetical protein
MRRQGLIAGMLVAVAATGLVACGGDGGAADRTDAGHDRDDYVTLLGGGGEGLTDEEAECAAGAVVDTIGVDALEEAEAWDEIQANPDGALSEFGIALDEAQTSALFDGLDRCADWRAFMTDGMVSEGMSPALAACTMDHIDDVAFERFLVLTFTEGEAGLDADPELSATFEQAGADCAIAGVT